MKALKSVWYDRLKWMAQYLLPATGTLYFALSKIWGLPYGEEIVGSITAIDVALGALLGLSSASYAGDGVLTINSDDPEKYISTVTVNVPLDELETRQSVMLMLDKTA